MASSKLSAEALVFGNVVNVTLPSQVERMCHRRSLALLRSVLRKAKLSKQQLNQSKKKAHKLFFLSFLLVFVFLFAVTFFRLAGFSLSVWGRSVEG